MIKEKYFILDMLLFEGSNNIMDDSFYVYKIEQWNGDVGVFIEGDFVYLMGEINSFFYCVVYQCDDSGCGCYSKFVNIVGFGDGVVVDIQF